MFNTVYDQFKSIINFSDLHEKIFYLNHNEKHKAEMESLGKYLSCIHFLEFYIEFIAGH